MTPGGPLDAVLGALEVPPPELPRLTVGNTFSLYAYLGQALEAASAAYAKVPRGDAGNQLKEVIRLCDAAAKHAGRLLEANR